jgi:hypothetical protein
LKGIIKAKILSAASEAETATLQQATKDCLSVSNQ